MRLIGPRGCDRFPPHGTRQNFPLSRAPVLAPGDRPTWRSRFRSAQHWVNPCRSGAPTHAHLNCVELLYWQILGLPHHLHDVYDHRYCVGLTLLWCVGRHDLGAVLGQKGNGERGGDNNEDRAHRESPGIAPVRSARTPTLARGEALGVTREFICIAFTAEANLFSKSQR